MRNKRLRRRFILIIAVYFITAFALWLFYQNTVFSYIKSNTTETAAVIGSNLVEELSREFSQMELATSTLAGSIYVQDFLAETDKTAYYEKAGVVSEIIRKTTYPHMGEDSVLTVTAEGIIYRFTGNISNDSVERLLSEITDSRSAYSVIDMDGTRYFCIASPVYSRNFESLKPDGYVVTLSNLTKARRILTSPDRFSGIDTAVILDDMILFSSNTALDGENTAILENLYGSVIISNVTGGNLNVAAAITSDALNYGERLFITVSLVTLTTLVIIVLILYRVLSSRVVLPTIERADTMRMGLLNAQIDAHFLINTIACIESLAAQGKTEKIETAAGNLAEMLKSRHSNDAEINVFDQMENVQRYIEIMNIRYNDKFQYELEAEELFRCRMMGQILQPLVENAMTHGLGNKTDNCRLSVTGKLEADCILIEVADNGKGLEPAALRALQDVLDTADEWESDEYRLKGVALINIQRRIRAQYGGAYGLTMNTSSGGLTVTVRLPIIAEMTDHGRSNL